jgi:predicted secreted protein
MTCIPGRYAKLQLSDDAGVSYEDLGGIVDVTLNINIDELECTSHDSNGVREYIPNHSDFTLDVSARWIDGDAGQDIVLDAVDAKTVFLFKFTMETAAGKDIWSGSAFATSASPSGPLDDTGSLDLTLRCSSVVRAAQT